LHDLIYKAIIFDESLKKKKPSEVETAKKEE